jgi:hypothetical protein
MDACGSWRLRRRALAAFAVAAAMSAGPAATATPLLLMPGTYRLHDHPDGELAPPTYGLRLDELYNVASGTDRFAFSFDHPGADVRLTLTLVSASNWTISIFGTAFGGRIVNHQFDPANSGFAEIDFTYHMAHFVPGDDDLIVDTPTGANTGTITFRGTTYGLFDKANDEDYTFRLGNEDDDQGHREFDGISGWGWVVPTVSGAHVGDFIFTVEIPGPGGVAMLGAAGFLGGRRRRTG